MAAKQRINVVRLSFVHYQHHDLPKAVSFLEDFGLIRSGQDATRIYFSGYGVDPYSYIAEQSPNSQRKFLGGTWTVSSAADLEVAASHPQASPIEANEGPGGGMKVTIIDPNGYPVSFIHGQQLKDAPETKGITRETDESLATQNSAYSKPRQGRPRRFELGPSPVHKPGHYGYIVPASKYKETFEFYTTVMNLKPTDAVFDPETREDKICFTHIDLGKEYTDHHSFFLGAGPEDVPAHVHHTSFEVNDFDTQSLGHDWLRSKGWTNCWGIGRHVLGSQIFDYWFDASGNILEHYSDGDLVNQDTPFTSSPESPNSLYIWGPNIPLAFITGKLDDAGKLPPAPPVMAAPNAVGASA